MTEEKDVIESQLVVRAVDGDSITTATRARLEIEGQKAIILGLAELALAFMESLGGKVTGATDLAGNPVDIGPTIIDPLADTGTDPVA